MKNHAASNRQRLLNLSRKTGRGFQELVQYFAMSRFLYRLGKSPAGERVVLKGALLLHALEIADARSTLDIDLMARFSNSPVAVRSVVEAAIDQDVDPDGLEFLKDSIQISDIARDADYEGRRVRFVGNLGVIVIPMQLDLGFGDSLIPPPSWIATPTLLGYPSILILGYAPETSIAEKTHAIFKLGMLNSRMKDLYDISLLARTVTLDKDALVAAISATFAKRGDPVPTESVVFTDAYFKDETKQEQWSAFVRKRQVRDTPEHFSEVAREVIDFLKPFLERAARLQGIPS
jgi:predicted nucleotidyltransferase component of viral defense system